MSKILYKDLEISNSCEDFEWEDAQSIAHEVIDNLDKSYRIMYVIAGNVDWTGQSATGLDVIPDADDLWRKIAGWRDADWTLRVEVVKNTLIRATAYSHDTPTGGSRTVKFLNGNGIYALLRNKGMSKREIQLELDEMGYLDGRNHTIEQLKEILEGEVGDDDLLSLLAS
jgi:hypothetical protein